MRAYFGAAGNRQIKNVVTSGFAGELVAKFYKFGVKITD